MIRSVLGAELIRNIFITKIFVPLANLDDIVFGTWDVYPQNSYQAAVYAEVLKAKDIEPVREELMAIKPFEGSFRPKLC